MPQENEVQALEAAIERALKNVHVRCLGYGPDKLRCEFLRTRDLLVSVERRRSKPEKLLLNEGYEEAVQLAGYSVNQGLKKKFLEELKQQFGLVITHVATLKPSLPEKFNLLISIEPAVE
ncbi:MAG: Na-translocating system protein MpsC family protein [Cyanobacteria bacterium J06623_5]